MNKRKLAEAENNTAYFMVAGLLIYCLGIIGCSTTLYSVNMNYDAGRANIPGYLKADSKGSNVLFAISEFTDSRKGDEPMVIGRVVEKDGMKTLILPKYTKPTKAIASGIRAYLNKAGYKGYVNTEQWDLKEETIPKVEGKLLIGGNIEALDLTCRKGFPTDSYKAKIKLGLVLADAANGKILYRGSVETDSSLEHVSFSEERLEEQINIGMADAIEKVFEDKNLAQKIKEALNE